jgi:glycosyltransferase involved in cell wall biosynthesis
MKKSVVSVLVPTYNSARRIRRCIESVLAQSHGDLEVTIRDNASTDETVEICREYAKRDSRITVLGSESNVGPLRNWRTLSEAARSKWTGLLFSDDWYEPSFIERAIEVIDRTPNVAFVYSSVRVMTADGSSLRATGTVPYSWPGASTGVYPAEQFERGQLQLVQYGLPHSPACALIHTQSLREALAFELPCYRASGAFEHGAGPDVLTYLFALRHRRWFGYLKEPLVNTLLHSGNLSGSRKVPLAYFLAKCDYYDEFAPQAVDKGEHMAFRTWNTVRRFREASWDEWTRIEPWNIDIPGLLGFGGKRLLSSVQRRLSLQRDDVK